MFDKLGDETERLLDGDTADERDHMRIVSLGNLFHRINLVKKVCSLTSCSAGYGWEGGGERQRERERERER